MLAAVVIICALLGAFSARAQFSACLSLCSATPAAPNTCTGVIDLSLGCTLGAIP
jgi:hypothetical protein